MKNTIKRASMITARRIKMITVISGDSSMTSSGTAAAKIERQRKLKKKTSLNLNPLNHSIHQALYIN